MTKIQEKCLALADELRDTDAITKEDLRFIVEVTELCSRVHDAVYEADSQLNQAFGNWTEFVNSNE